MKNQSQTCDVVAAPETIPPNLHHGIGAFERGPCRIKEGQQFIKVDAEQYGGLELHPCNCGLTFALSRRFGWVWPKDPELRLRLDAAETQARIDKVPGFTQEVRPGPWAMLGDDATVPEDRGAMMPGSSHIHNEPPRLAALDDQEKLDLKFDGRMIDMLARSPADQHSGMVAASLRLRDMNLTNARMLFEMEPDQFVADAVAAGRRWIARMTEAAVERRRDTPHLASEIDKAVADLKRIDDDLASPEGAAKVKHCIESFLKFAAMTPEQKARETMKRALEGLIGSDATGAIFAKIDDLKV